LKEHSNLYYLLLEDMERNPLPEQKKMEIQKNIEKFYKKIKPPWNSQPLTITKDKES
jgi:hypothetical protein